MITDLINLPTSIDIIHLILAPLTLILFILLIKKPKQVAPAEVKAAQPIIETEPKNEPEQKSEIEKTAIVEKETIAPPQKLTENCPNAALQLLALLQQEARFIDFIKEDLSSYSDADIGAAARVVHEGSKKTLDTYFILEPIRSEDEEARISLPEGFNASEVRLTGNVVGEAPFNGTLIHKGWKVSETKLPKITEGHDTAIVAPAEVEL